MPLKRKRVLRHFPLKAEELMQDPEARHEEEAPEVDDRWLDEADVETEPVPIEEWLKK